MSLGFLLLFLAALPACLGEGAPGAADASDATADVTLCDVLEVPPLSCVYAVTSEEDRDGIVCAGATAGESWALPGDVCLLCPPRDPTQPMQSFALQEFTGCGIEECAGGVQGCSAE